MNPRQEKSILSIHGVIRGLSSGAGGRVNKLIDESRSIENMDFWSNEDFRDSDKEE